MLRSNFRPLVLALLLLPTPCLAQGADAPPDAENPQAMDHSMMHQHMNDALPREPGQSAFAAIQEIVALLEADPATDWSKVDIDALRSHLADMDAVTLHANVSAAGVDGGIAFTVTGEGEVRDAIRRMVTAHAGAVGGAKGWRYDAEEIEGGARLTVLAPPADLPKLKGLGFFGILAAGMHHQEHHLMLARGGNPHH